MDELSQKPSPLSVREGTSSQDDTVPSVKVEKIHTQQRLVTKLLGVLIAQLKAKVFLLIKCQRVMMLSL